MKMQLKDTIKVVFLKWDLQQSLRNYLFYEKLIQDSKKL